MLTKGRRPSQQYWLFAYIPIKLKTTTMEHHFKGLTGNTDNKPILEITTTSNRWVESIRNLGLKPFVPKKRQFHFTASQTQR